MRAAKAYIGLTDPDWYSFLSTCPRVDEVNFWQPRGNRRFRALESGGLFFFKLRGPLKAIVGFGFFQRFEILPAWLAWEVFGEMNGAPDFESMMDRIVRLRRDDSPSARMGEFKIGCIMVSAPVFFSERDWVSPPRDWAKTGIQQGKSYDLTSVEGRRILDECLARAGRTTQYWNVDEIQPTETSDSPRYGRPVPVRPRLGQGLFGFAIRDAYRGACAVTREHSQPALEAAHIIPYAQGGQHRVDNGLLLRSDLHRLYDRGYVTVTPDNVFRVGDRLRDEFKNGRSYYGFDNSRIVIPTEEHLQPSKANLDWHARSVFKG